MSNNSFFMKPENALKRANEFTAIGNKAGALTLLHDVLSQRKVRTWAKSYETIMMRYVDLCVDLKDHHRGKDGLHQYRNLSQAQAPGSLETVIMHFLDSAEAKLTLAASTAEAAVEEAAAVTDLEQGGSPESLMMSTMTEEGERQRKERKLLVPCLIFVWETYRAVLDILRSNSKLEVVYHKTAHRAFDFCDKFKRKVEFRRLCEMLRTHLGNLSKAGLGPAAPNDKRLRGWDGWTDESVEMHLTTRFKQLEVTTRLELWTEGFRTVEDIHAIMHLNPKKPPKSRVMANYYDKLIRIFWVSENYLFHAYAWLKYYTLSDSYNTKMTAEERSEMANHVVLAALAIPDLKATSEAVVREGTVAGKDAAAAIDETAVSAAILKNQHMAMLLGFHSNPSRASLMADIHHRKLLDLVSPEVGALFMDLEATFQPLGLVARATPNLAYIANADARLATYAAPLTKLVVLRLLKQLAVVYHTVTVEHFLALTNDLSLSHDELEKIIVVAVKDKMLFVRIDHQAACLRFGEQLLESDNLRQSLTKLAQQLRKVEGLVDPLGSAKASDAAADRAALFAAVRSGLDREHAQTLNRKAVIERRKEEAERREKEAALEAEAAAAEAEEKRKANEVVRLADEAKARERRKREQMQAELEKIETQKLLVKVGVDTKKINVKDLGKSEQERLIKEAEDEAEKKVQDAEAQRKDQAKRLDYITRAVRDSELPLLAQKYQDNLIADEAHFKTKASERAAAAADKFKVDTATKGDVGKMFGATSAFEKSIMAVRKEAHAALVAQRRQEAYNRKIARARRLKNEADEAAEEAEYERQRAEEEAERAAERAAEAAEQEALMRERMLAEQEAMALRKEEEALAAEKRAAMIEEARQMKAEKDALRAADEPPPRGLAALASRSTAPPASGPASRFSGLRDDAPAGSSRGLAGAFGGGSSGERPRFGGGGRLSDLDGGGAAPPSGGRFAGLRDTEAPKDERRPGSGNFGRRDEGSSGDSGGRWR